MEHEQEVHMPRRKGTRHFVNRPPRNLPENVSTELALSEFAARLQKFMLEKNMTQSDLARAAAKFMPNKKFNRDNVSQYVRGLTFPYPIRLNALARALGVQTEDLRPPGIRGAGDRTPMLDVRSLGDGNVMLRVNQSVSMEVAMKIVNLLSEKAGNGTDKGK